MTQIDIFCNFLLTQKGTQYMYRKTLRYTESKTIAS